MLLDGLHLVREASDAGLAIDCVAVDSGRLDGADLAALARIAPADGLVHVSRSVLEALSPVHTPTGVVALAARPSRGSDDLMRDGDGSTGRRRRHPGSGNLGAIVRAAEAGGATAVITTRGGADPFGWKAIRGAMGSAFRLPIVRASSAAEMVDLAQGAGLQVVVAAVGHGHTSMHDVDFTPATLIVLGSEGHGPPSDVVEAADVRVAIPMTPPVESLNVAVAAALLVYEARRQRQSQSRRHDGAKATMSDSGPWPASTTTPPPLPQPLARTRRWPSACGRARSTRSSGSRPCSPRGRRCGRRSRPTHFSR